MKNKETKSFTHFLDLAESGEWQKLELELVKYIAKEKIKTNPKGYEQELINSALRLSNQSEYTKAGMLFCEIIARQPENAEMTRNLAVCARNLSHKTSTLHYAKKAVKIDETDDTNWNTLGIAYYDLGKSEAACEAYQRALDINPRNAQALTNIAGIYHSYSEIDKSYIHATKALEASAGDLSIVVDHLTYLRRCSDIKRIEKVDWIKAISLCRSWTKYNAFLMLLTLIETVEDNHRLKSITEEWATDLISGDNLKKTAKKDFRVGNKRLKRSHGDMNQPIKIALLSGDFRDHSVARFIWPLFEYADRSKVKLICLSNSTTKDNWTYKFIERADDFVNILSYSPSDLKDLCKQKDIDVLIDLAGFTKGSNIYYMMERMAPIQASWLGYPGTSGINNIDYIFSDKYLAPKKKGLLTEQLLLTKGTSLCFENMDLVPITEELPCQKRGYITFGSLNNTYKLTRRTLDLWAKCMSNCQGSKLFLARREYNSYYLRENILSYLKTQGIRRERISFYNNRDKSRHYLDCYNEIDISLDTIPLTGGTTTVDALWMGVPVITLEGHGIHQRISSAILKHLELDKLIALSDEEFLEICLRLCNSLKTLQKYRTNLRKLIKDSALCDGAKFTSDFTEAFRNITCRSYQQPTIK